ncbi:MAG: type I-E CRISPR-associated protein Cas5/CasD [Desulfovibrio sp.]|nr:type I-E CRISPR-associated protein Cas5/CasD [Desulfovibrio sp.]
MSCALLWLEAPLQSWGADSRFGRRSTLPFPTRSGIMGLVCCALGKGGEQVEWLAKWGPLKQTIAAFARKGFRPAMLRDFHMVGSGYDSKKPWQDMLIPKTSEGKRPVGGGSRITYRYYLQDMAFACALELPDDEMESVKNGLQSPVWNICLGRKNCVPTEQVFRGIFEKEEDALEKALQIANGKDRREMFRVKDGEHEGETFVLNDVPLSFGLRKKYQDRQVTLVPAKNCEEIEALE